MDVEDLIVGKSERRVFKENANKDRCVLGITKR